MNLLRLFILAAVGPVLAAATSAAIPMSFEQREAAVFVAHAGNTTIRFRPDRVTFGDISLRFDHAVSGAKLVGIGPASPATYFDETSHRTYIQYFRLAIQGLYPGIDAVFYGHAGRLEYDLAISPGAHPERIRLRFDGARRVCLGADGSLTVETGSGELRQLPPRVFQSERPVQAGYILTGAAEATLRLGRYNHRLPLTIDPELVSTQYFGGSASDFANAIATDSQGNVYVSGRSNSIDFPSAGPSTSKPPASLIGFTNAGQTVTNFPIGIGSGVSAIGGTPDGAILYAASGTTVYYSSNAGASWTATSAIPFPAVVLASTPNAINDITVDAIDPSRAYVATTRGIFGTSDNGQSWAAHDFGLLTTYEGTINAAFVTVSQVDHTILYATTSQPVALYKSTNAGGSWTILNPALPGEAPNPFPNQFVVALAPGGTDLYVGDPNGFLLKSSDGGNTWQKVAGGLGGFRALQLDALNPSHIFVWRDAGVGESTDGGNTFTTIKPPGASSQDPVNGIAYEPVSHTFYIAISSSILATTDDGATWQTSPVTVGNIHIMRAIGGRVYLGIDTPQTTFLVKFDATGSHLLYSTFFTSQPLDNVQAIQVDAQGDAYVAGYTLNRNFAGAKLLAPPAPIDRFNGMVAKVAPDGGSLLYLAILGGSNGAFPYALALDSSGSVYLTGSTTSSDFPTTPGSFQTSWSTASCTRPTDFYFRPANLGSAIFVSKLAPDGGSFLYSTFLNGSCGAVGRAITVNAAGEALVGGWTDSPDMPVTSNAYQSAFPGSPDKVTNPSALTVGYAARLGAGGDQLLAGTYVGGGYTTLIEAVTLDSSGNAIFTGSTWGIATGSTPGAYQTTVKYSCLEPFGIGPPQPPFNGSDAFALKLDGALSKASFLTYLGGSCFDSANSLALDASGDVWLAGNTYSGDFPVTAPFQNSGCCFVSELSPDGSKLLFSSYADGAVLSIDPHGIVSLAGSTLLPVIPKNANGNSTALLARIDSTTVLPASIDTIAPVSIGRQFPGPFSSNAIAPGQLIQINGHGLGPADKVNAQLDSTNRLPFLVAGTRVLFDGAPAALISVQDTGVECFVPFAASKNPQVAAEVNGQLSNAVRVTVQPSAPQILAIVNQDGSMNSASSPAAQGTVVTVYVSGLGQTQPPSVDGQVNAPPLPVPIVTVGTSIGNFASPPQFVAAAAGMVAGITQVNVPIPLANYPGTTNNLFVNGASALIYVK